MNTPGQYWEINDFFDIKIIQKQYLKKYEEINILSAVRAKSNQRLLSNLKVSNSKRFCQAIIELSNKSPKRVEFDSALSSTAIQLSVSQNHLLVAKSRGKKMNYYDQKQGSLIEDHVTAQSYRSDSYSYSPKAQFGVPSYQNEKERNNFKYSQQGKGTNYSSNSLNNSNPNQNMLFDANSQINTKDNRNPGSNLQNVGSNLNNGNGMNKNIVNMNAQNPNNLLDESYRNLETFGNYDGTKVSENQVLQMRQTNDIQDQSQPISYFEINGEQITQQYQQYQPFQQSFTNGQFLKEVDINHKNEVKIQINIVQPYNPNLSPPDWNAAQKHGDSTRVGMDLKPEKGQRAIYEMCPCCDSQIEKEPLSISDNPLNLLFLGSGYPLFFDFIIQCLLLLTAILSISGCYDIYTNYTGTECQKKSQVNLSEFSSIPCHKDFISILAFVNKQTDESNIYISDLLDYFTVLVLIIMFVFFRKAQIEKDLQCDVLDLTPSDYTIMIKNIPKHITKAQLQIFFEDMQFSNNLEEYESTQGGALSSRRDNKSKDQFGAFQQREYNIYGKEYEQEKVSVKELNFVYLLHKKEKQRLEKEEARFQRTEERFSFQSHIHTDQQEIRSGLERVIGEIKGNPDNFSGYAFLSLESDKQRDLVLNQAEEYTKEQRKSVFNKICDFLLSIIWGKSMEEFSDMNFFGKKIQVCKAPEPLEIIWENIMTEDRKKHSKRIHSFLYTIFALTLYTLIIYYLNNNDDDNPASISSKNNTVTHEHLHSQNMNSGQHYYNQDISGIDNNSDEEGYTVYQMIKDQLSNVQTSVVMILLNSLVVKNAFEYIVDNECYNTYSLYKINMAQKLSIALFISNALVTTFISIMYSHNIYGNGGLIYVMIFYLTLDILSTCLFEVLDLHGRFKYLIQLYYKFQGAKCKLKQEEANKLSEMPVHEIEICYAEIINTMYISVFYSPILPVGLILSGIGLTIYYWVQKYTIIKKRTVKQQISIKLSQKMTNSLELIVFILPLSNVIFHFISNHTVSTLQLISLLFGALFQIIPTEQLVKQIFAFNEVEQEQQNYDIAYTRFKTTYARLNPISSAIANSKYYEQYAHVAGKQSWPSCINYQNQQSLFNPLYISQAQSK